MINGYLTGKQRLDIRQQFCEIRKDIFEIENKIDAKDDDILYFYEKLKIKIDFAYDFVKSAKMYNEMEESNGRLDFKK